MNLLKVQLQLCKQGLQLCNFATLQLCNVARFKRIYYSIFLYIYIIIIIYYCTISIIVVLLTLCFAISFFMLCKVAKLQRLITFFKKCNFSTFSLFASKTASLSHYKS